MRAPARLTRKRRPSHRFERVSEVSLALDDELAGYLLGVMLGRDCRRDNPDYRPNYHRPTEDETGSGAAFIRGLFDATDGVLDAYDDLD